MSHPRAFPPLLLKGMFSLSGFLSLVFAILHVKLRQKSVEHLRTEFEAVLRKKRSQTKSINNKFQYLNSVLNKGMFLLKSDLFKDILIFIRLEIVR